MLPQVGDVEIAASIATTLTTVENVLFLRFFKEILKSLGETNKTEDRLHPLNEDYENIMHSYR